MTCIRMGGAIVCVQPFYRLPLTTGDRIYMEWHTYFGPTFYKDRAAEREVVDWYKNPRILEALDWFCKRGHVA